MLQPWFSLRRTIWPLAASLQMLNQTVPNIAFDLTVGADGVAERKVVPPTFQVPIQLTNQNRNRLEALTTLSHFVQLLPLPLDRFPRRKHIQVLTIASFPIAIVAKCISQKVQTCPFLPQIHHPRLFPIDLQLELSFQSRLDERNGFQSHLFR